MFYYIGKHEKFHRTLILLRMKGEMTFWDHLEEFRQVLIKSIIVIVVAGVVFFIQKEWLTAVLFAPSDSDFILFRFFCQLAQLTSIDSLCFEPFKIQLLNTQITSMFYTHMLLSLYAGLIVAIPFISVFIWQFVSPALYKHERKYGLTLAGSSGFLFLIGITLGYFLIFPLAARFFWMYEITPDIEKKIELSSYLGLFTQTILMVGVVFELPLVTYFLAKIGLISAKLMKRYRKHAFILILLIAGFITPPDPLSMFLVALPMYLLYEMSIFIVLRTEKKQNNVLAKTENNE